MGDSRPDDLYILPLLYLFPVSQVHRKEQIRLDDTDAVLFSEKKL